MNEIFGVPAHPLFVHIPVVLIPLALLCTLLMAVRPSLRKPLLIPTAAIGGAGAVGAILASQAGEWLQERVRESQSVHDHAQLGEMARNTAILFAGALFVWALRQVVVERSLLSNLPLKTLLSPTWVAGVAMAGALLFGSASTFFTVRAGHTGAKAAWDGRLSAPRASSEH
jgi:uncharacterized membrane protein